MGQTLYKILEWITRFAYINALWIIFTLAGGILLGLFPATVALYSIIRQWLKGNWEQPIFQQFFLYYKLEFWKSNRLGIFLYTIGIILTINIFFLYENINLLLSWTAAPFLAGIVIFILLLFYLFPAYVHFDEQNKVVVKDAFLIMLISPIYTLGMFISIAAFAVIVSLLPALFFIFGVSFYGFITMWFALHAFNQIQHKRNV
ncbi:YesL family protein [Sutcliffiella cohnii]